MAYKIDTNQYQLHLYIDYDHGDQSPWNNPNLFLLESNAEGTKPLNHIKLQSGVTGKQYFLGAYVNNNGGKTTITEMHFGFPTWVSEGGEKVKQTAHGTKSGIVGKGGEQIVISSEPISFIHSGNYEMDAQIKKWFPEDHNEGTPPDDWPTSGPLYARNSIEIKKP